MGANGDTGNVIIGSAREFGGMQAVDGFQVHRSVLLDGMALPPRADQEMPPLPAVPNSYPQPLFAFVGPDANTYVPDTAAPRATRNLHYSTSCRPSVS